MANSVSNKKVVKSATWYTISSFSLRAISIITAPIFTRLLATSDYGIASNFSTWCTIVYSITGLGLTTGIIRGKLEFKEDYKRYLSSIQFLSLISAGIISLLCIIFLEPLSKLMVLDKILIVFMLVYLLTYPSVSFAQINYRFEYKYRENILISVVNTFGTVVVSIALILMWTDYRYLGRCIGSIVPIIIIGFFFCCKILYEGRCFYNKEYWKYALRISLPMVPHALAMQVLGQIDRIMIINICGESEAGIYSFGYSYAVLISLLTNALNEAVQPMIYQWIEEKKYRKIDTLAKQIGIMVLFAAIFFIIVGPEVLTILGTKDFFDGRWVIFPVVIGSFFQYMYQNFTCVETYFKKTSIIAVGSISAAAINAILNAFFIPRYGYLAAGYTTLVGYLFLMIFHYCGARKASNTKIFSLRYTVAISIAAIILGLFCNMLYRYGVFVRYGVLIASIVALSLVFHKQIKKLLPTILDYIRSK